MAEDRPLACDTSLGASMQLGDVEAMGPVEDSAVIEFLTGSLEARLGEEDAGAELRGGVMLRQGSRLAGADSAGTGAVPGTKRSAGRGRRPGGGSGSGRASG